MQYDRTELAIPVKQIGHYQLSMHVGVFFFQTFGCDGHMHSGLKFDKCAVCNGNDDTCTKEYGKFTGGTAKGNNYIFTLSVALSVDQIP